eukprot:gnl/MRDRNA2_/MRDRNA2_93835_c0_seq1.p1 gnl/MRDRNA2_/MRDRNA2_93835_c0~~gnl/MRDRNA2_/MRDRNA2_93835_c0_seq1.p1  ORF type:complete len:271 (+),score=42.44 gnl/MRDRNA2_/MRDRNA2_93835_c0_seq1:118-930(+)
MADVLANRYLADVLADVDLETAQCSSVVYAPQLLTVQDLALVAEVYREVRNSEDLFDNNPQNHVHVNKRCVFLDKVPFFPLGCDEDQMRSRAPHVLLNLQHFAGVAWEKGDWSRKGEIGSDCSDGEACAGTRGLASRRDGPLVGFPGAAELSVRVVEHWQYTPGGKLDDPWHYDIGSVVTVVVLLNDEFEGGVFRTHEFDGAMLEHPMKAGDAVCFVSHKYHNVTEVTAGTRHSLVMELWHPPESADYYDYQQGHRWYRAQGKYAALATA